jgi:hypothetical protein
MDGLMITQQQLSLLFGPLIIKRGILSGTKL